MQRYGLLGNAKTLKAQQLQGKVAKPVRKAPARGPAVAAFGDDSDSDGGAVAEDPTSRAAVNRRLAEAQAERARQVEKSQVEALMDDPTVYDYDGVYEQVHKGREGTSAGAAAAAAAAAAAGGRSADRSAESSAPKKPAPRYINTLLEQAKMRTIEADRVYERKLAKEREEGDKEFGEAEMKFVTSAYKAKLVEQRKWEAAEAAEAAREALAEEDMKRGGGMTSFYSNLLTKNIAMGGDVANAKSAFTLGSRTHAAAAAYAKGGKPKAGEETGDATGADGAEQGAQAAGGGDGGGAEDGAPSARMQDVRKRATSENEGSAAAADAPSAAEQRTGESQEPRVRSDRDGDGSGGRGEKRRRAEEAPAAAEAVPEAAAAVAVPAVAAPAVAAAPAKADREAAIAAARARALARRKGQS